MNGLKNKVVFITGSSIGIGRETAYKFAKEECKLVITYFKDRAEGMDVSKKCLGLGASEVFVLQLNVMEDESIKDTVKKIIEKFGGIDILINNAGIIVWKKFKDQTYEDIENQTRTNFEGLVKMTKECLPYVKGLIINIASGAGLEGYPEITTYCGTKFAVRGFSQALAQELKEIKVYVINPGVTATRMNDFHGTKPEKVAEIILNAAKGNYKLKSGEDVNVWELL
ncbi:SDR family oxidoreductase [Candidatus Woesearchaeota archaeon]|nr:SDR family oxidoreductase [Candidatus Woesearchaeota archaeon]